MSASPFAWRRQAREAALQLLYRRDVGGLTVDAALAGYWDGVGDYWEGDGAPPDAEVVAFAEALFRGTVEAESAIDPRITAASSNWRIERMAVVDRLVLRLAVYELQHGDVPAAVVIDEAIELARRYGGDDSARFVNGVLDAVRRGLEGA